MNAPFDWRTVCSVRTKRLRRLLATSRGPVSECIHLIVTEILGGSGGVSIAVTSGRKQPTTCNYTVTDEWLILQYLSRVRIDHDRTWMLVADTIMPAWFIYVLITYSSSGEEDLTMSTVSHLLVETVNNKRRVIFLCETSADTFDWSPQIPVSKTPQIMYFCKSVLFLFHKVLCVVMRSAEETFV